ncbi:TPA: hypothetical protein N5O35_000835 [Enterobacter hormaechei subsp. xiangfangensis]|nr:hypothetical protein [Enterobacter hormaechei subsp. xiangfangensis]
MSIKNLVEMIKHNGLLASMAQLEKLYQVAIENEKKVADLEAHLAALSAENVGLKSAIEKHADSYIMCGYCRTERDGKNDDVCEVLDSTPATDAFLAEVRAQGVEMFAAHKRERQQALRSRSMRMSEEAAGMAADAENFADELRKGVQS